MTAAGDIIEVFEAKVARLEDDAHYLIKELEAAAETLREQSQALMATDREAAIEKHYAAASITGTGGMIWRIKTAGQGSR